VVGYQKNINLKDITPYKGNAKKHNKQQIDNVAESIRQFGFVQPIVVDKNNVIVIGHCRYEAAKRLKLTEVPCVCVEDLNEEQVQKLRLLDNKLNESDWDMDLLAEQVPELDFSGFDVDWELPVDEEENEVIEDEAPEIDEGAEPIAKLGDIWQLGRHRLMCGDSTNIEDVEKLMNGEKARMLFTSPPYSDMREYEGGKNLDVDNIAMFIAAYRLFTDYQCVNLGIQRKDNDIVQYWDEYIKIAKESGYKLLAWNVWDKLMCGSIGQQSAFFPIRHEWIFVFGTEFFEINETWEKKEESIKERRPRKVRQADGSMRLSSQGVTTNKYKQMESVLPLHAELGEIRSLHPATFPVGLPGEYIKSMSDVGDIVIEPFCGSGTTLIACEQLDRCCYGMELEPKYVDIIINRWEQYTGEKAVLIND
jgi:DNA modification methylase